MVPGTPVGSSIVTQRVGIPGECNSAFTPSESERESKKDQRKKFQTSKKNSLFLPLLLGVNTPLMVRSHSAT